MLILKKIVRRLIVGKYFGLNQLDRKLEKYVNFDNGYFVELGANDGVTQSNSLYFERHRNWRGLLVEPTPHNFLKCRKNRAPRSTVYCAACVSFDYHQKFVIIAYANLMSIPLNLASDIQDAHAHAQLGQQFLKKDESLFEFGAIAKTLDSLLIDASAPKLIDFLSLDVEGAELEVLQGVNHQVFRFKYILVECRDFGRLNNYLEKQDYHFVEKLSEQDYLFASNAI